MAFPTKVIPLSDAFKQWLNATFAPKVHYHDDRYSLLGHTHDNASVSVSTKDITNSISMRNHTNGNVDDADVQILRNTNAIENQLNINGETVSYYNQMSRQKSSVIDIGDMRIICGVTPELNKQSQVNQLIRIKLNSTLSTMLCCTMSTVNLGKTSVGCETFPEFVSMDDTWLYVYMDGNGNANPNLAISYMLIGLK